MSTIREVVIAAAIDRAQNLLDYNIHINVHIQHEFKMQTILTDESLTEGEKAEATKLLNQTYDLNKIILNQGTRRICENCNKECLATLFCEYCVRNYLKENFSNWASGNDEIDNLIQSCQVKTFSPNSIVELIPYDNFENIKYLSEGGHSKIYTANWIDGSYDEWDSKTQQLKRFGRQKVALKRLENVENAKQNWLEEVCNLIIKLLLNIFIFINYYIFIG